MPKVKRARKTKKKSKPVSLQDAILQAVSPYYLYQRRVAKKSPKASWKATTTAFKKAIGGAG